MAKKIFIKTLKVIGWIVLSVIVLLFLVIGAIQIPFIQQKIVQKAVGFVEKKIGTPVALDRLTLSFPKKIVIQGLYLQDEAKDTLLYAGEISVDTDLWGLMNHEIQLNDVALKNITASVSRKANDSTFNYDYIIKAFADTVTVQKDTTQKPWIFSLYGVDIETTNLHYHDSYTGNNADVKIGNLEIDIDDFDLEKSNFKIDDITLDDITAKVVQTKMPEINQDEPTQPADSAKAFNIDFNQISLNNIQAAYTQKATGRIMRLDLDKAMIVANAIDLIAQKIDLKKFKMENTFLTYQQMVAPKSKTQAPTIVDTVEVVSKEDPWTISLSELELKGNSLQFHDFNKPFQANQVDFNHLWISKFNTEASDIHVRGSQIEGALSNLSLHEKSGFGIRSFQTIFNLKDNSADIKDFVFDTGLSKIAMEAHANFESFETLSKNYADAKIKINIDKSYVAVQDVLYLNRTALDSLPLQLKPYNTLALDAAVNGQIKNLNIHHVTLSTLTQTILQAHGNVRGLPDMNRAFMQITLDKLYTTHGDVKTIIPAKMLPKSIQIPEWVNLAGTMEGTLKTPDVKTILTSSIGTINLKAKMNLDSVSKDPSYKGDISLNDFDMGKLLKQDTTMGKLNMVASVTGSGLKMEDLNAKLDVKVKDFSYQNYTYRDFNLDGSVKKYFFSGLASLQDKNLDFNIKGDLDYNEEVPLYKLKFELKNADFKALHMSLRPLRARGTLEVNLATSDFKVLNGSVDLRKVAIFNGEKLYAVDSLLFASIDQKGQTDIKIDSDIISGSFKGTINLFSLPDVMKRYFNTYFSMQDSLYSKPLDPQNFKFYLELKKTDLITDILLPDLKSFEPGPITGEFNSSKNDLYVRMAVGRIQYTNVSTDSLLININSTKHSLNYNFFLQNVMVDSMLIYGLEFDGTVANDSIKTIFAIRDSLQEHRYKLGGVFNSLDKGFQFRFLKNMVMLNYEKWNVPPDNYVRFGNGLVTKNLSLSHNEEKISVLTKNDKDSTMSVVFRALDLSSLAGMISGTKILVDGKLNGDVNVLMAKDNAFDAHVNINDLTFFEKAWGELALAVNRATGDRFDVKMSILGENTDIKTSGYYAVTPTAATLDVGTTISKLNLSILEPLTDHLKNLTGQLTGSINVTGDLNKPNVAGGLTFKEAHFLSTYVNTSFTLKNETIKFAEPGIVFKNFSITDAKNNVAKIDGDINTTSFSELKFNLRLNAINFHVLNTTAVNNELFYGKVGLNTTARITGTSTLPVVDVKVGLSDDSEITYVVPQAEKAVMDQEGIVQFIDRDAKKDPFLSSINPADTVNKIFKGFELTANIELNDKEIFNVIIDPATGDKLSIQGNTTLSLRMDPNGNMELTGRYEISKGTYALSFYKMVKRNFEIDKGSTIMWTGEPLNANMDIRAIYKVETSPLELVGNQTENPDLLNQYKQRMPFLVFLNIKGELFKPEISFKLDMPIENRNAVVYAKLQDINTRESDLNKQVFALLILKRFMSDNPFDNQAGDGLEGTARRSVSKLLSEQLNRLSQNVKGLELNFDVKSYQDYSSGRAAGQTSLQLGVSKKLLNDKLVVKLAGNVDVEGQNSKQNSLTDYIGDLALEYKITPDGRLRITGFRNGDYDMIDGELTKTGAGLIYIKDYNVLSELFRSNRKNNEF